MDLEPVIRFHLHQIPDQLLSGLARSHPKGLRVSGSFRQLIKALNSSSNLEENGYLEIQDNLFPALCDDDTVTKDSKLLRWSQLSVEGTDKIGQRMTVASEFESMLKEVGFVDVEVRMEKWPVSPWSDDPKPMRWANGFGQPS